MIVDDSFTKLDTILDISILGEYQLGWQLHWRRCITLFRLRTSAMMLVVAMVTRFVEGDPFQIRALPQTNPRAMFHPNTAVGKLNAVMMPTTLEI
jgi:hypothetical protein